MRIFANICLILVAAAALTGCGRKQFVNGGCTSGCTSGCCAGGGGGGGRFSQSGRMYGQNVDPAAYAASCQGGCDACGDGRCGGCHLASGWRGSVNHGAYKKLDPPHGPQGAQVAYPYYTTRGPRDFLVDNPPGIGN